MPEGKSDLLPSFKLVYLAGVPEDPKNIPPSFLYVGTLDFDGYSDEFEMRAFGRLHEPHTKELELKVTSIYTLHGRNRLKTEIWKYLEDLKGLSIILKEATVPLEIGGDLPRQVINRLIARMDLKTPRRSYDFIREEDIATWHAEDGSLLAGHNPDLIDGNNKPLTEPIEEKWKYFIGFQKSLARALAGTLRESPPSLSRVQFIGSFPHSAKP